MINSLVGIGIGALFAWRSAQGGGDANDQALAYFLPGHHLQRRLRRRLMVLSIVVALAAGRLHGRQRRRRPDRVAPRPAGGPAVPQPDLDARRCPAWCGWRCSCPIYLAGRAADDAGPMIAALGVSKIVMGWPLQIAALAGMAWLLARNRTPVDPDTCRARRSCVRPQLG